jgi:5-formyltetrahydrofolate cyclo-ligase
VRRRFDDKQEARQAVWDRLQAEKVARFPFPPHGRIPNFKGAETAARRLFEVEPFRSAKRIKVNPDAPQRHVRIEALRRGMTVFVPTPRLRGGFKKLDPEKIPDDGIEAAASLSRGDRFAQEVALEDLPELDAIVAGSVAVTRDGRRCGKGEGYSDLEYAILRELGHPPVPVATTVHAVQIVGGLPAEPNDLPLVLIVTPEETIDVADPPPAPSGIDWRRLDEEDLEAMPVLAELRRLKATQRKGSG